MLIMNKQDKVKKVIHEFKIIRLNLELIVEDIVHSTFGII